MDFRSKWYDLSNQIAGLQNQKDISQATMANNAGLLTGLGALGFRGNQNAGSMERLAGSTAATQGAAGLAAGQSKYNNLAQMYGKGLSEIELPMMQGKDMQNALNSGKSKGLLGLGFMGL